MNRPLSSLEREYGPENPFKPSVLGGGGKVGAPGLETTNVDTFVFRQQYGNFQKYGFAQDTSSNAILGNIETAAAVRKNETTHLQGVGSSRSNSSSNSSNRASGGDDHPKKKAKASRLDLLLLAEDDDEDAGPWGKLKELQQPASKPLAVMPTDINSSGYSNVAKKVGGAGGVGKDSSSNKDGKSKSSDNSGFETLEIAVAKASQTLYSSESSNYPSINILEPEEEAEKWERFNERKLQFALPPRPSRGSVPSAATTTFHGAAEKDYQGRAWCHTPSDLKPESDGEEHQCYIPKKCVKKLVDHTQGVHAIEFFPGVGHLLLSGSYDGTCKIWDVLEDRNVLRTYSGHSAGVRSINFHKTGKSFVSSGFDRYIRLWDVETGVAKQTFTNRQMNYCVKFAPRDDNVFLAAASDNKIYQWDCRSGQIALEYNIHLQAVNTVMFFDDGFKFVSTSDDKKILVWEYDTPIPIQQIQESELFSLPALALHPDKNSFVGQSLNNTMVVYDCERTLKLQYKKVFRGHNNSGYACQMTFSPNGKYLASGDGFGKLFFWDWKSGRLHDNKFQAHDGGACISAQWHPLRPSLLATCGMADKTIKLWE